MNLVKILRHFPVLAKQIDTIIHPHQMENMCDAMYN